jgi:hypothetical protein
MIEGVGISVDVGLLVGRTVGVSVRVGVVTKMVGVSELKYFVLVGCGLGIFEEHEINVIVISMGKMYLGLIIIMFHLLLAIPIR